MKDDAIPANERLLGAFAVPQRPGLGVEIDMAPGPTR